MAPRNFYRWIACMIALLAIGCKVGPDFVRPSVYVNPDWSVTHRPDYCGEPTNIGAWWEHLNDPTLTRLIYHARMQNLSLKEAGLRIVEARHRRAVVAGNLFPQLQTANGAYSKAKTSSNVANFFDFPGVFEPNLRPENWQVGLQTAWELDFWGKYRRLVEAADAAVGETEAVYRDAMVLLNAEVANAYIEIRSLEARMDLAQRNLDVQRRTLEMAREKKDAGIGNAIDVAQATTIYGQTEATFPTLEVLRRQANHRLCSLLGRTPTDLCEELGRTAQVPRPSLNLAFGIPADLLRRRPDVRQAEQRLAQQSAKIGVAEAEFYPHISLTGSVGYTAEDFNNLFQRRSSIALLSPGFSWNILNYGRIRSNVEAEKAAFCSLAAAYQQSILDAQREVEDAQVAYILGYDRLRSLHVAAAGAQQAVEKAELSYREGAIDYGRVYILQSELLRQQDQLVEAETDIVLSLVEIFEALGGGWETPRPSVSWNQICSSNAPSQPYPAVEHNAPWGYDPNEQIAMQSSDLYPSNNSQTTLQTAMSRAVHSPATRSQFASHSNGGAIDLPPLPSRSFDPFGYLQDSVSTDDDSSDRSLSERESVSSTPRSEQDERSLEIESGSTRNLPPVPLKRGAGANEKRTIALPAASTRSLPSPPRRTSRLTVDVR